MENCEVVLARYMLAIGNGESPDAERERLLKVADLDSDHRRVLVYLWTTLVSEVESGRLDRDAAQELFADEYVKLGLETYSGSIDSLRGLMGYCCTQSTQNEVSMETYKQYITYADMVEAEWIKTAVYLAILRRLVTTNSVLNDKDFSSMVITYMEQCQAPAAGDRVDNLSHVIAATMV